MNLLLEKATTILPVDDPARAHRFYAETLGLHPHGSAGDGSELFGQDGGPLLELMPVGDGAHSSHTAMSFEVTDLESVINEMSSSGVEFLDYDLPGLRTENHVCTTESERCAWFMDSENNILCIHETL